MAHDSHGGMPSGMDMNMNATHSPTTMNMNNHGQHNTNNMDGMGHENMMMVSIRLLMLFLVQRKRLVGFDSETQIF